MPRKITMEFPLKVLAKQKASLESQLRVVPGLVQSVSEAAVMRHKVAELRKAMHYLENAERADMHVKKLTGSKQV